MNFNRIALFSVILGCLLCTVTTVSSEIADEKLRERCQAGITTACKALEIRVRRQKMQQYSDGDADETAAANTTLPIDGAACSMIYDYSAMRGRQCPIRERVDHSVSCRPDWIILGARKGGTTSLHTYLSSHVDAHPFRIKPGHSDPTDGEIMRMPGTRASYDRLFKGAGNKFVGESSVAHIIRARRERMHKLCDPAHVRLIVLMRDPIERCHSQFLMRARFGSAGMSAKSDLSAVMRRESEGFARRSPGPSSQGNCGLTDCLCEGAYSVHLNRLLADFPHHENIRLYFSEHFFAHTEELVRDAMAFVGLDPSRFDFELPLISGQRVNNQRPADQRGEIANPLHRLSPQVRARMAEIMRAYGEELERMLNITAPWKSLHPE
jgi:hypothetical protein